MAHLVEGEAAQDLDRVRYVAANYSHLQGLRKVPNGLFVLMLLAASLVLQRVWQPGEHEVVSTLYVYPILSPIFTVFVGTILFYYMTNGYHERRFGSVELLSQVSARRKVLYGAIVVAMLLVRGVLGLLILGVAMLFAYGPDRRFQKHHVALALLAVGLSLALIVGAAKSLWSNPAVFDAMTVAISYGPLYTLIVVSAYFIVGGVLDHMFLVNTMRAVPEADDD